MIEQLFQRGPLVEIALLTALIFFLLRFFRGTRGATLLKGIIFLVVVGFVGSLYIAELVGLVQIKEMLKWLISGSAFALVVVFAPELRRAIQRLAQSRLLSPLLREQQSIKAIRDLVEAVLRFSKNRIGALIAIEQDVGLNEYIENAVKIDARLTTELIQTIFYPGSALHDGAVIVRGDRVAAAGCLFPLTDDPTLTKELGTRHRAALGISEDTDAIVLIVSEETGTISLCAGGKLQRGLDREGLEKRLYELYTAEEKLTGRAMKIRETQIREKETRSKELPAVPSAPESVEGNGNPAEPSEKQEQKK